MSAVSALGYVRIAMADPEQWRRVGEDVLGFSSSTDANGAIRLRLDGAPLRYLIEPAHEDRFLGCGWQCSAEAYPAIVESLQAAGAVDAVGSLEQCEARCVSEFVSCTDPSGNSFELFHSRGATAPFESALGLSFVADELGLGHAVLPAADFDTTSAFYAEHLGFALSDALTLPPPMEGVPEMRIHFLHATNPRHHSLGLFNGPAPSGVVHLMTELNSLDEVGACLDRVKAAGLPITASLGRHLNDGMVSFYFLAPAGIPMEVGYDGNQYDWSTFTPTHSTVGDVWGHEYAFPE